MPDLTITYPGTLMSVIQRTVTDGQAATLELISSMEDPILIALPRLTGAECGDLAVTAAEGGIGYWSVIESYHWQRRDDLGEGWVADDGQSIEVDDDFVFYAIEFDNPTDDTPPRLRAEITPALIRRGFQLAITKARRDLVADIVLAPREDWMGDIDADGADVIIQCGVFGEVVFG